MNLITKIMLSIHRILGTILSILFLVWFLSGFVMIYHTFPRADQTMKLSKMEFLSPDNLPSMESIQNRLPENEKIKSMYLNRYLGQTVFYIQTDKDKHIIPADSAGTLPEINTERIKQVVALWNNAPVEKIDTMYHLDQWIPFGQHKKEFPIYKYHFADQDAHELYISSRTGEVLQYTDKSNRFWAWLGPIPHWIYFTTIRQDIDLWIDIVVWLSGIGCIMCIAGIYLGIRDFRLARKMKQKKYSPYKKFWYKWHHIIGAVFGVFVLTFCFSGMMSLARVQNWGIRPKLSFRPTTEIYKQKPSPTEYPLDYRDVIKAYPNQIRQLEWSGFGAFPSFTLKTDSKSIFIDASDSCDISPVNLSKEDIKTVLSKVHGDKSDMTFELINEYDNYYVSSKRKLDLPVWKITIQDVDNSCYYINPKNGQTRYVNTPSRWQHWMYPALHSLNIGFLARHPVLWNIVMWTLLLTGTFVSLSGVWLAFKYIKRLFNKARLNKK